MSAAALREPPWHPPAGPDAACKQAGIAWDAVQAPAHLGRPAREMLGDATGAIIRDSYRGDMYWLLPVGATVTWAPLPDVTVYGTACFIWVPPQSRTSGTGPYWLPDTPAGQLLTHPTALHAALSETIAERYPPDAAARLGITS